MRFGDWLRPRPPRHHGPGVLAQVYRGVTERAV
jgi:hypothetical protein